jgi:hypothetical protein
MEIGDNDDDDDDDHHHHHHRRMAITMQEETDEVMDNRWRHTMEAFGSFPSRQAQGMGHADMRFVDWKLLCE